jgi:NitT/TauT family transport system permease protein/sulfonate transport system permease protein
MACANCFGTSKLRAVLSSNIPFYLISTAVFFVSWDCLASAGLLGLPRVFGVLKYLWVLTFDPLAGLGLFGHIWASLHRVLLGFVLAVGIGVPLGFFMATNPFVDAIVGPVFTLLKPMPPIAWISLAILWFGIGEQSKVFLILIGTVIPCIINSYNGIRLVDPGLYDVIRMLGGNKRDEAFQVMLPASFPSIFAGIQLALSMAWTCVVAAELIASRSGMGFIIIMGMNISSSEQIFGGIIIIAIVGWFLAILLGQLERFLCPWKREI